MAKVCYFCGKKPSVGGTIVHRGISKKAGGIGLKLVKTNKRVFKPNIQKVKIIEWAVNSFEHIVDNELSQEKYSFAVSSFCLMFNELTIQQKEKTQTKYHS